MTLLALEQTIPLILLASIPSIIFIYYFDPKKLKVKGQDPKSAPTIVPEIRHGIDEPDLIGDPNPIISTNKEIKAARIGKSIENKISNDELLFLEKFLLFVVIWIGFFLLFSSPVFDYRLLSSNIVEYEYLYIVPIGIVVGISIVSFIMIKAGSSIIRKIAIIASIPVVIFILTLLPAISPAGIISHFSLILITYVVAAVLVICGVLFAWYLSSGTTAIVSFITSAVAYALLIFVLLSKYIFFR